MVMNLKFSGIFFCVENFTHFLVDQQKPPKKQTTQQYYGSSGRFSLQKMRATNDSGQKVFHPI